MAEMIFAFIQLLFSFRSRLDLPLRRQSPALQIVPLSCRKRPVCSFLAQILQKFQWRDSAK